MLPGELGEIPTTDDATNCNNITWIIKYLPKSRVGFFHLLNDLVREGDFCIIISRGNDKSTDAYLFSDMIMFRL